MSLSFKYRNKLLAKKTIHSHHIRYLAILHRKRFFSSHPERGYENCHDRRRSYTTPCPACGYPIQPYPHSDLQCHICGWEDDGCDDPEADTCGGGPNDSTLTQARKNFAVTFCVWHSRDRKDFNIRNQLRLFHPKVVARKKRLCALYNELMNLSNVQSIQKQWKKILTAETSHSQQNKKLFDHILKVNG